MTGATSWAILEHSSPNLTNKVYTNVDLVLRNAVDQIPVGDWLTLLNNTRYCFLAIYTESNILVRNGLL